MSDSDHVQTKREIRAMLEAAGIRPQKRYGQHFLIDGNLMRKLVASAELQPSHTVLEVGAGTGGLTDLLVERAAQVVCVEVDGRLCVVLTERFAGAIEAGRLTLVATDVLERKHRLSRAVVQALGDAKRRAGGIKLVANLPYGVATPLVMNLLIDYPQVQRMVFTVQAEVGARFTAGPSCRDYGPVSVLAQALGEVGVVARVPAQAFWPVPQVDSVMLRLDRRAASPPLHDLATLREFAEFLRKTFEHRRKTLRGALGYVVAPGTRDRICESIDGSRRPESLTVCEWLYAFEKIRAAPRGS